MTAANFQDENSGAHDFAPTPSTPKQRITWEDFQRDYLTREDEFLYEWLDGEIEISKRTMNYTQAFILKNLQVFLRELIGLSKANGEFIHEVDAFFGKNHRRPDSSFFSNEQIAKMTRGENQVPLFIIEIISTNDQINLFSKKMKDYRAAGVRVVWEIRPEVKEVYVYSDKDLKVIKLCMGEDLCSAAPVLDDFMMSVNDVLKMPEEK
ncbi:MAG: Uma2 family endonuclease [Bacteroidota bacterium]